MCARVARQPGKLHFYIRLSWMQMVLDTADWFDKGHEATLVNPRHRYERQVHPAQRKV